MTNRYSKQFIQEFSFPRMAGSEGEKKAQRIIEEELKNLGVKEYQTQEFEYSWFYMNILLRIYDVITAFLLISCFLLMVLGVFLLSFITAIILFFYSLFSRQIREFLHFNVAELGTTYKSQNYIVEIPAQQAQNPKQNIIFLAHYDSISHNLHPIFSGALYFLGLAGGCIFSIHIIVTVLFNAFSIISSINYVMLSYGLFLGVLISIQVFNSRGNESPGTGDNATAVANAFYLIKEIQKTPLINTNFTVVFTGAEEVGDFGAYNYIKTHYKDLSTQNTFFIIVDTVAVNEKENLYFYGQGYPKQVFSPYLKGNIEKVLSENKKYKEKFNKVYIPPLIAYSTDHAPLKPFGYEFIIFGSNGRIHSELDNMNHFHQEMMKNFNEFSLDLLREVDKTQLSL